ncbi:hypothetical protein [Blastococcus brunescens]|uniref:Secreted protein n=1 Tax=Blastococcus brunescens TaxID=1564165 RepID=A0ABZ1AVY2_9ACTN|nr:hypothetical protein [Blastococcus sp. BMG 8361]WRL62609.1 hypothetical protein U6N30_22000 [Blastococcus sp. BMG 8361]
MGTPVGAAAGVGARAVGAAGLGAGPGSVGTCSLDAASAAGGPVGTAPGTPPHDQPTTFLRAMRSRDWAWWRPVLGCSCSPWSTRPSP